MKHVGLAAGHGGSFNAILADADAKRDTARETAEREIQARRQRIEKLEQVDEVDEVDEELENPLDLLESVSNYLYANEEASPSDDLSDAIISPPQPPSEPLRRSARVRTSSIADDQSRSQQQPVKMHKPAPPPFQRLIAEERRERRKGIDGATAERMLDSLQSPSPTKLHAGERYPTPDSIREPSCNLDENVDMDKLAPTVLDSSAIGVMLEDVKRSKRDAERGVSRRRAGLTESQGFWQGLEPRSVGRRYAFARSA